MKVPVLFIIFNRPETARVVFQRIKEYQPDALYVAADGPRIGKEGEEIKCQETRDIIKGVDWNCEVKTLFREKNLGCGLGVSSAISWFFENVEYGIIIEDDVMPELDFFKLCEIVLPKYKTENKIMMISSYNPGSNIENSNMVGLTKFANIWAWATWSRAWREYDITMSKAKQKNIFNYIKWFGFIIGVGYHRYCKRMQISYQKTGNWHTWDYQWALTLFVKKGYSMVPYVNLTKNIGVGIENGTHYFVDDSNPYNNLKIGNLLFPLVFPNSTKVDRYLYKCDVKEFVRLRKIGLKRKIKKYFD